MAKETTSQKETTDKTTATQTPTPEPASIDNTVDVDAPSEAQVVEFDPLFDDEDVSDDDLRGEEAEEKPSDSKSEAKDDTVTSPPEDKKESKDKKADEDKPDEDKAEEADDKEETKPPKGYVPIQALHQERGQRQMLSQQVQSLQQQLESLQSGKQPETVQEDKKPEPGFEVLTDEQVEELIEDDPVEAMKYDRKFRAYQDRLRSWEASQQQKQAAERQEQEVIERSIGMMAESVPGLYDQDSDVNQKLSDFAVESGFADLDGLALVTDPRVKVIPPNGGKPRPLGETAANLVLMLNNLFNEKSNGPDTGKIEKQVEARLRDEITKELLSKLKTDTGAGGHKSIGDVPGESGQESVANLNPKTEQDFLNLSAEEERRLLGG